MPFLTSSKFLFISGLTVLTLAWPISARALVTNPQNDFVKDVNNGKADLAANPAAKSDVADVSKNETETANDEDGKEVEDKDAQEAPEQAEPTEAPESSSEGGDSSSSDTTGQ